MTDHNTFDVIEMQQALDEDESTPTTTRSFIDKLSKDSLLIQNDVDRLINKLLMYINEITDTVNSQSEVMLLSVQNIDSEIQSAISNTLSLISKIDELTHVLFYFFSNL